MKQASKTEAVYLDDGQTFVGFHLEADCTAEHEWGIRNLLMTFDVPWRDLRGVYGIERRKIATPGSLFWHESERMYMPEGKKRRKRQKTFGLTSDFVQQPFAHVSLPWAGEEIVAGTWDGGNFGILVSEPLESRLREMVQAFERLDVAIFLAGGGSPFQGPGLSIMIASRLAKEITEEWDRVDRDAELLRDTANATGIADELKAAGRGTCGGLTPRWKGESGGELEFWMMPTDESKFNYGWYSLDDLRGWIRGQGPVLKTAEEKAEYEAQQARIREEREAQLRGISRAVGLR